MQNKKKRPSRSFIVLITCILALPTVACIMGYAEIPRQILHPSQLEPLFPYLAAGLALGLVQVILRPVLRIITAPLGCITFGLSGTIIDIALIYLADHLIESFRTPGFTYALLTALLINGVCAFVSGRR